MLPHLTLGVNLDLRKLLAVIWLPTRTLLPPGLWYKRGGPANSYHQAHRVSTCSVKIVKMESFEIPIIGTDEPLFDVLPKLFK